MSAQLQKTPSQSVDHHELQHSEQVDLTEGSVGFQAVEGRLLWRASGYGVI